MKKSLFAVALAAFVLLAPSLRAQEKSQEKSAEKPKADERSKISIPIKVQLTFTEMDGDKKVSSIPYSFIAIATGTFGRESASIRSGVRIPVETDSKDQKINYMDIGTNLDCRTFVDDEGRFHLALVFDRSSLYSAAGEEKKEISHPEGAPVIRSFRVNQDFILRDGQTSESVLSSDPFTGHVLRVSITLNVIK